MKFYTYIIACLSLLVISCKGQNDGKHEIVEPTVFATKIDSTPNAQILDVRTPIEYATGHIENATNIDWNGSDFETQAGTLDKSKPVFVYCMKGGRSKKASDKLAEMGFKKVYDLDGGYVKWCSTGLDNSGKDNLTKITH